MFFYVVAYVSIERTASTPRVKVAYPKDRSSKFFQGVDDHRQIYAVSTQKTAIQIFTYVKTSDLWMSNLSRFRGLEVLDLFRVLKYKPH